MIREAAAIAIVRQKWAQGSATEEVWLCRRPREALMAPGYTTLLAGHVAAADAALLAEEQDAAPTSPPPAALTPNEACAWRLVVGATGLWPHCQSAAEAAARPPLAAARQALLAKEGDFLPTLAAVPRAQWCHHLHLWGLHDAQPFSPSQDRTSIYVLRLDAGPETTLARPIGSRMEKGSEPAGAGPRSAAGAGAPAGASGTATPMAPAEPEAIAPASGPWGSGAWHTVEGALTAWSQDELALSPVCAQVLQWLADSRADDAAEPAGRANEAATGQTTAAGGRSAAVPKEGFGQRADGLGPPAAPRAVYASVQAPRIEVLPVRSPTLPPSTHTNCYLLGGPTLAVVDPGTPYEHDRELLLSWLAARVHAGARLEQIWLTHHHDDHIGAAMAVRARFGAKIYAHEHTASAARGRIDVDRLVADDEVLQLGGQEAWRALYTPGHAAGHLCFYESSRHHLLSGDNVLGTGTSLVPPAPHGSVAAYNQSLRRILALPLGLLLPGHGPPSAVAATRIASTLRQREAREAMLVALVANSPGPLSLASLQARLYRGLALSQQRLAALSMQAHLDKLVDEHKVALLRDEQGQVAARWLA